MEKKKEIFYDWLLQKIEDFQNQQQELKREFLKIGETRLARQAVFDATKLKHLAAPFLDDEMCTSKEGFVKLLDEHMDGLPERYSRIEELSPGYAIELYCDCVFLVECLFSLDVIDLVDCQRFGKKLDKLIKQSTGLSIGDL